MSGIPHFRQRNDYHRDYENYEGAVTFDVTFFFDGTDTEARLTMTRKGEPVAYGEGFAYLARGDHYERSKGKSIALGRALIDALEDLETKTVADVQTEAGFEAWREFRAMEEALSARDDGDGYPQGTAPADDDHDCFECAGACLNDDGECEFEDEQGYVEPNSPDEEADELIRSAKALIDAAERIRAAGREAA